METIFFAGQARPDIDKVLAEIDERGLDNMEKSGDSCTAGAALSSQIASTVIRKIQKADFGAF